MKQEIAAAVRGDLSTMKFFPSGALEREAVMRLLERIVDHPARLRWLVDTLVNYVGTWPDPAQLRALYATRFKPADGVEGPYCTIAGFTPLEAEMEFIERGESHKKLELAAAESTREVIKSLTAPRTDKPAPKEQPRPGALARAGAPRG